MQMALDFNLARERGLRGMERAVDHAERVHSDWGQKALAALRAHVRTLPFDAKFIVEDVRGVAELLVPEPPDRRAWGAVTQAAIRSRVIVKTGEYAKAKSSNLSPKPIYRRGEAA